MQNTFMSILLLGAVFSLRSEAHSEEEIRAIWEKADKRLEDARSSFAKLNERIKGDLAYEKEQEERSAGLLKSSESAKHDAKLHLAEVERSVYAPSSFLESQAAAAAPIDVHPSRIPKALERFPKVVEDEKRLENSERSLAEKLEKLKKIDNNLLDQARSHRDLARSAIRSHDQASLLQQASHDEHSESLLEAGLSPEARIKKATAKLARIVADLKKIKAPAAAASGFRH